MFEGFFPETVDFLWGIRLNNNREWFMDHKKDYTRYLYEPMKELGQYLFEPFLDEPGKILKVSRIYRDARLHYPVPYKESLWISIRRDVQWWTENPCQFFEITPEGVSYGMVFWKPKAVMMEKFRKTIAREPEHFLDLIRQTEAETGIAITADQYKRRKPCDDERLERFYQWKGNFSCVAQEEFGDGTFSPELAQRARKLIMALSPLTTYLEQFGNE